MKKITLSISLFSFLFFACSKTENKEVSDSDLPQVIEVGAHEFIIEADVFRDKSPNAINDSLQSGIRLIDRNGNALAGLFALKNQRLLQGSSNWNTEFDSLINENHITYLEAISYGGPLWEPGSKVEVICTFEDIETKEQYKILAPAVVVFEKN